MNLIQFSTAFPLKTSIRRENEFRARVVATPNGQIIDTLLARDLFYFFNSISKFPRRVLSAGSAVRLNDQGGTLHVQEVFDIGTFSTFVNMTQGTSSSQPVHGVDNDVSHKVPVFDGSNDLMNVDDLSAFAGQTAGTVILIVKDYARLSGDTSHRLFSVVGTSNATRYVVASNVDGNFNASARRLDGGTIASANVASANGFQFVASIANWSANKLNLQINGVVSADATGFGSGATTATPATAITIGALNAGNSKLNGVVAEVIYDNAIWTTEELNSLRSIYRKYYPTLP